MKKKKIELDRIRSNGLALERTDGKTDIPEATNAGYLVRALCSAGSSRENQEQRTSTIYTTPPLYMRTKKHDFG
jgi:hypothetical protein